MDDDQWTIGPTIGRGSTATVRLATAISSGEVIAVKSSELSNSETLRREQSILSLLNSPRVISYRGFRATEAKCELFMELAPGGSLCDEIRRRGGSIAEPAIKAFAREILLGLRYIHSKGVVHCDVKGANVLVTGDGKIKIDDLGCAKRHVDGGESSADAGFFGGTIAYMAPEVARGEDQGFPADIWAFGCTVIEMLTGRVSWIEARDPVPALYRVGFSDIGLEIPGCVSEEGRDFLGKCLRRDAKERWSASELLEHPFVVAATGDFGSGFGLDTDSPKSVLEIRDSECSDSGCESGSESPGERVKRLCCGGEVGDWACEMGWITVRGNWAEVGPERVFSVGPKIDLAFASDVESETMSWLDSIFIDGLRNCKYGKRHCCSGNSRVEGCKRGSHIMPSKCAKGHILLLCDYNELYCSLCILSCCLFYLTVGAYIGFLS